MFIRPKKKSGEISSDETIQIVKLFIRSQKAAVLAYKLPLSLDGQKNFKRTKIKKSSTAVLTHTNYPLVRMNKILFKQTAAICVGCNFGEISFP